MKCKTFIHNQNDTTVYMDGNHGKHAAKADGIQKKIILSRIKEIAKNSSGSSQKIVATVTKDILNPLSSKMPN